MKGGRPEYFDVCHPADILWSHDGNKLESRSAKGGKKEHKDFVWFGDTTVAIHDADGRVDTAKGVGILAFAPNIGRRQARRIAEDVVAGFPGIKFWVFYGSDWGVSMQEFWEATA